MSKIITVNACCACPFFQQTTLGVIAALMSKAELPLMGECGCPSESGLMHFAVGAVNQGEVAVAREKKHRRLKIHDGNSLPRECPLYRDQVVVTLKVPS